MIKILTFISVIFIITSSLISAEGWKRQYSNATERLEDVFFLNNNTGWISGADGTFMKTENAGLIWKSSNFSSPHFIGSIYFINENTGWVSGRYDYISISYKTTDGGMNWNVQLFDLTAFYSAGLRFFNENTGWLINCGNTDGWRILKTTNGGDIWMNTYVGHYVSSIYFLNEQTAWATGCNSNATQGAILKTTNGGVNWLDTFIPETVQLQSVYFANENTGWAVGIDGAVLKSTNGGSGWIEQNRTRSLTSVKFINDKTGWISGFAGILKTTNGGDDWGYQNVNQLIWGTCFVNGNTGWAVGTEGLIYKTTDGGGDFEVIPKKFELFQNYPNPFNPKTTIKFSMPERGSVKLNVYDLSGKLVAKLVDNVYEKGNHKIVFNAEGLASGVYFYKIVTDKNVVTKKMVLVK